MGKQRGFSINTSDLHVARVVHEDNDYMILEIVKDENRLIQLQDGDRFYSMIFLMRDDDGSARIWTPWEEEGGF